MSAHYINLNGDLLDEQKVGLSVHNRAFKYGDCLFETVRIFNGKPLFLEDHFSRLVKGMKVLQFELPPNWDLAFLRKEVNKVIEQNDVSRGGRARITVFRKGGGLYTPLSNEIGYTIEVKGGEENQFSLNEKGLSLGIYEENSVYPTTITPFKTSNCIPYILMGIWGRERGYDEALSLNNKGNIVEGISSNVFVLVEGILYTPAISEGPTAGIMRKKVIQLCKKAAVPVIETSISPSVLEEADEVFTSNSIRGIQWVSGYKKKRYFHKLSAGLVRELNDLIR